MDSHAVKMKELQDNHVEETKAALEKSTAEYKELEQKMADAIE